MESQTFGAQIWAEVAPYIAMLVSAMLTWSLRYAIAWLKAKSHDASYHCAMDKIENATTAAVRQAEQTVVAELKRDAAKLTREDATTVFRTARDSAVAALGPRGIAEIRGCLGLDNDGVLALLGQKIEEAVHRMRTA